MKAAGETTGLPATRGAASRAQARRLQAVRDQLALPLVWLHADTSHGARRLLALSDALLQSPGAPSVVLTHPHGIEPLPERFGRLCLPAAADDPAYVRMLGAEALPNVLMCLVAPVPVRMVTAAHGLGIPVCLIEMDRPIFATRWMQWPGHATRAAGRLAQVFLRNKDGRVPWGALGLSEDNLPICGHMSQTPVALGCNDAERDALAEAFRNRTIWLAAGIPEDEEEVILDAHAEALRDSHRLALILHPHDPQRGAELKARAGAQFSTALRSIDDPLLPDTQVYIADTEGERGLWYRLATACYLGGTLTRTGPALSPMEAAGLGCATVHGRMFGRFAEEFDLLREARATRMIQSRDALGAAIRATLRPEQAADMAHRGWQVIAEGSEATERVIAALLEYCARPGAT